MKATLILLLLAFTSCEYNLTYHQELANRINKLRTTWHAEASGIDRRPYLGSWKKSPNDRLPEKTTFKIATNDLPDYYDPRDVYLQCQTLREIRDQSTCGSNWAFAAAEVMSDRLCIHSKQKLQTRVSAAHLTTCCKECGDGCKGGSDSKAFLYWKEHGIPSGGNYGDKSSCKPYFLPPCDDHPHECLDYVDTPQCEAKCIPEYPKELEKDKSFGVSAYSIVGEVNMMKEIMENGPISVTFTYYEDFDDYKGGIYQHVFGPEIEKHTVKLFGWGVQDGVKYWYLANSWNEKWAETGYFRILKGVDECGVESEGNAAMPRIEGEDY